MWDCQHHTEDDKCRIRRLKPCYPGSKNCVLDQKDIEFPLRAQLKQDLKNATSRKK